MEKWTSQVMDEEPYVDVHAVRQLPLPEVKHAETQGEEKAISDTGATGSCASREEV
jgi:hypothetical protein